MNEEESECQKDIIIIFNRTM